MAEIADPWNSLWWTALSYMSYVGIWNSKLWLNIKPWWKSKITSKKVNWLRVLKVKVVIIQKLFIIQTEIYYETRFLYYIMHKENRDVMQNWVYYAKEISKHDKVCKEKSTV